MSGSENGDDQSGAGRREVAYRAFAAEYDDATLEHSESDEERAPNYVVTPTGARINRLFVVGVLTEIEQVNEEVLRARIVDPTGAYVVYAGQYQPDEMAFLERADPPAFLAVTGKARTFQPEDSDRVYTSIRPESINEVDADTRDRWVVQAAEQTLARVATMATALERPERGDELAAHLRERGVDAGLASGVALAIDHYGTTPEYLAAVRDLAIEAAAVVAGERDEASQLAVRPADGDGSVDPADLADIVDAVDEVEAMGATASDARAAGADANADAESSADAEAATASGGGSETTAADEPASGEAAAEEAETEAAEATETAEATAESGTATSDADSTADADTQAAVSSADTDDDAETTDAEADDTESGDGDRLGDFEPGGIGDESAEQEAATADANGTAPDADQAGETPAGGDEMYEFSDEEREQIEEEYGTEFSTGTEVADPGEADIETPAPDADAAADADAEVETDAAADAEPAADGSTADVTETDESVAEGEDVAEEAAESVPEADAAAEPEDAGAESGDVEPAGEPADDAEVEESEADAEEPEADVDEPEADAEEPEDAGDAADAAEPDIPDDVSLTDVVVETMREMDDGDGVDRGDLIEEVIDDTGMTEPDVEDAIEEALMGGRCYEPTDDTLKPI